MIKQPWYFYDPNNNKDSALPIDQHCCRCKKPITGSPIRGEIHDEYMWFRAAPNGSYVMGDECFRKISVPENEVKL